MDFIKLFLKNVSLNWILNWILNNWIRNSFELIPNLELIFSFSFTKIKIQLFIKSCETDTTLWL